MTQVFWIGLYPGIGEAKIVYMLEQFHQLVVDLVK